jgi:hypothetical protein
MFEVAGCPVWAAVLSVGAADGLVHGATAEALGGQLAAGLAVIARVLIVHYYISILLSYYWVFWDLDWSERFLFEHFEAVLTSVKSN